MINDNVLWISVNLGVWLISLMKYAARILIIYAYVYVLILVWLICSYTIKRGVNVEEIFIS